MLETEKTQLKAEVQQRDKSIKELQSQIEILKMQLDQGKQENERLQQWIASLSQDLERWQQAAQDDSYKIPGADVGL